MAEEFPGVQVYLFSGKRKVSDLIITINSMLCRKIENKFISSSFIPLFLLLILLDLYKFILFISKLC